MRNKLGRGWGQVTRAGWMRVVKGKVAWRGEQMEDRRMGKLEHSSRRGVGGLMRGKE